MSPKEIMLFLLVLDTICIQNSEILRMLSIQTGVPIREEILKGVNLTTSILEDYVKATYLDPLMNDDLKEESDR